MRENMDNILKESLRPQDTPSDILNRKVLNAVKERENMNKKNKKKLSAAVAALALIAATSSTVFAAYHLWTASQVAEHLDEETLAEYFADNARDTQVIDGYEVSLLGVTSGKDLSSHISTINGEVKDDRTYCVISIAHTDGSPVDDEKEDFFVSPLIGSLNPAEYNAATMFGGYTEFVEDGVLYRLLECENVEYFADKNVYVCVTDTTFYNNGYFNWNESKEIIERDNTCEALNALFALELDVSKADTEKAAELLSEINKEDTKNDETGYEKPEILDWAERTLTPENLEEYCVRMENTVHTVSPDENGWIEFKEWSAKADNSDSITGKGPAGYVEYIVDINQPGLQLRSFWGATMEELLIETYTLNEDGSVTFAVWVPKDVSIYL